VDRQIVARRTFWWTLLENPYGVQFENVYSKSLQQSRYLTNLLALIEEIGCFTFASNKDVILPTEVFPNFYFIFDNVAYDK